MTRSAGMEIREEADAAEFRALLDAAVDGIIAIDHEGNVVEFNPAAQRLFGYTAEEIIGRNVSELMPEPDRSRHSSYIQRYLETGKQKIIGIGREVTGRRADGTAFPLHLSVGDAKGGRFIGIIRDLSAEKAAEEEGQKLNDRLAEVDRFSLMGEMAAGLAHEINQVIQTVRDVVRQMSVETVVQACLAMEEMDLREDVKKITAPSLVIGSTLDYLTPMETAGSGAGIQYLIDNLSDCESKIYTDIGHADLLEKKEESLPLIVNFLKQASKKVNR